MTRLRTAEFAFGVGALVLGIGVGAWLSRWFTPVAGLVIAAGLAMQRSGCGTSTSVATGTGTPRLLPCAV